MTQLADTEWDTGAVRVDVWFILRRRAGVVPKRSRKASTKWEGLLKPTVAAITVIGRVPCRRISLAVFRRMHRMNSWVDCPVKARNRRFKCILLMARQDAAAAVVKRGSAMCSSTIRSMRARNSSSRLPPPSLCLDSAARVPTKCATIDLTRNRYILIPASCQHNEKESAQARGSEFARPREEERRDVAHGTTTMHGQTLVLHPPLTQQAQCSGEPRSTAKSPESSNPSRSLSFHRPT
ncbi:MAG: hypothetical protein H6Q31_1047 [Bacteroidetes bacterium]|nr:hypothetical protein [Bacteroidota bacterium]